MSTFATSLSPNSKSFDCISVDSPWGTVPLSIVKMDKGEVIVIDRHFSTSERRTPPHVIEHRANVHAAICSKPDLIVSVNSVGAIRRDLEPGTVGVAGDILDLATMAWTFHDDDAVHADRTTIFDKRASEICADTINSSQQTVHTDLIVAQCVGPQFESPSEIDALEKLGADVVGMTLGPESRLISESGLAYVGLPCCSNWAAGRMPGNPMAAIDHEDVADKASMMLTIISSCIHSLLDVM
jgi:purine nucleoside phosphorylase